MRRHRAVSVTPRAIPVTVLCPACREVHELSATLKPGFTGAPWDWPAEATCRWAPGVRLEVRLKPEPEARVAANMVEYPNACEGEAAAAKRAPWLLYGERLPVRSREEAA